jgi:predicted TIM-barrel fold metal-dependent hydrolase
VTEDAAGSSSEARGWDCHVHVFDAAAPVREGHYRPVHRPLARIEAEAATLGIGHLVLVQPSVYGTDNRLLLAALAVDPGRHRGVVVLDDSVDEAALDAMQRAGVRGARLNLQSPVGEDAPPGARFERLAPRLRARGWHLQWYATHGQLSQIASWHAGSGVACVLDHLGGMTATLPDDDPAWEALARLADLGACIKLSGWYRLQSCAPYGDLTPTIRRVAALFGDRMVWGSDWPHTAFAPDAMPAYATLWAPVVDALGDAAAEALRNRRPSLYR